MKRLYGNRIKYRGWVRETRQNYGSIVDYIINERLQWDAPVLDNGRLEFATQSEVPFADPADYKIAWNDWPYGSLEPDVKHLIVWLKKPLPADLATGKLLPRERQLIQSFVNSTFLRPMAARGIGPSQLRWFKNGLDLQSVKAIDHFHVLVKNVPDELLFQWTHAPEPIVQK